MYTVTLTIKDGLNADVLTLETSNHQTYAAAKAKLQTISDYLVGKGYGLSSWGRNEKSHRGSTVESAWVVYTVTIEKV